MKEIIEKVPQENIEQAETPQPVVEEKKSRIATRDSGIELLRIFCMIFIIAHHFACHNGFDFVATDFGFNRFLVQFLYSGGKIGVDVFVLITGFFMYKSNVVKFDRIFKLWLQLFTFNIIIYLVFLACGQYEFNWQELLHNLLPISFERNWFVSAFFVLTLLIPPLNVMIKNLTQKRHLIILIIGTIIWSIIPTLIWDKNYFFSNWEYNSIIWFIYLYVLGAYVHKYGFGKKEHGAAFYILLSLAIFVLNCGATFLVALAGKENEFFFTNRNYLFEMQTVPVLLMSVLLLMGFSKLKIGNNKVINFISATTFGIYLIHDNDIFRVWLWKDVVKGAEHQDDPKLILIAIISIIVIFIACGAIEFIRQLTIEKLYKKPIEALGARIDTAMHEAMPDKQIIK